MKIGFFDLLLLLLLISLLSITDRIVERLNKRYMAEPVPGEFEKWAKEHREILQ